MAERRAWDHRRREAVGCAPWKVPTDRAGDVEKGAQEGAGAEEHTQGDSD